MNHCHGKTILLIWCLATVPLRSEQTRLGGVLGYPVDPWAVSGPAIRRSVDQCAGSRFPPSFVIDEIRRVNGANYNVAVWARYRISISPNSGVRPLPSVPIMPQWEGIFGEVANVNREGVWVRWGNARRVFVKNYPGSERIQIGSWIGCAAMRDGNAYFDGGNYPAFDYGKVVPPTSLFTAPKPKQTTANPEASTPANAKRAAELKGAADK